MLREVQGLVLKDEPRFGWFKVQNFQVRSNNKWKIYPFFYILCSKFHWFGSSIGLFSEFLKFEVQFQRVFLRLGMFGVWYFQSKSNENNA